MISWEYRRLQSADLRSDASQIFRELRSLSVSPSGFLESQIGADLWVDGYDAVASTSPQAFDRYLAAFSELLDRTHSSLSEQIELTSSLRIFDTFLKVNCDRGEAAFWNALTVGICVLHALGGVPQLCSEPHVVVNDTVMTLVSRNYRAVRFQAFNDGAQFKVIAKQDDDLFRPEFGQFSIGAPLVVYDELPKIQFYNIAHEMCHVILLGDTYIRTVGTPQTTATLLLCAEEAVIGLDLLMMRELCRFGIDLHAAHEFRGIEPGMQASVQVSTASYAASDPQRILHYQIGLKVAAQNELEINTGIGRMISQRCAPPFDIDEWISKRARSKHIRGARAIAESTSSAAFQQIVSFLPQDEWQFQNLLSTTYTEWTWGDQIFGMNVPQLSSELRRHGIRRHALRFLVIRAAEIARYFESRRSECLTGLMDDLMTWASKLGPFCGRQLVSSKTKVDDELIAAQTRVVRAIIRKWCGRDLKILGLFDDPSAKLAN